MGPYYVETCWVSLIRCLFVSDGALLLIQMAWTRVSVFVLLKVLRCVHNRLKQVLSVVSRLYGVKSCELKL